ncbi:hypothetical protein C1646_679966 [Rhizophagus diaphanus]|nr:hypothetical protein C1646_679966 [Rhizophagus diaphanus] [Rhizophagus sp. MUCL 43196]
MSSSPINHPLSISTSTNAEHLDLIGEILTKKYEAILKILGDNESNITHNYALKETITLMENLADGSKKDIKMEMKSFVSKVAGHISNLKWQYYGDSTARLELILRAMSSVLHILSKFVDKLEADTRDSLYKSISKFWAIYRNSKCINANIVFSLREIRNCLRLIKDDQTYKSNVQISFESIINVLQEEYVSAFLTFIQLLNVSNTHLFFYLLCTLILCHLKRVIIICILFLVRVCNRGMVL